MLTVAIFAIAMLLTVRVTGLFDATEVSVATRLAALEPAAGTDAAALAGIEPAAGHAKDSKAAEDSKAAMDKAEVKAGRDAARDPSAFTDAEIKLLQQLAKRRVQLDRRAKEMELREGLLKAAEKRVEAKIAELTKLKTILARMLKQKDDGENKKIETLVRIYEKMKPKDAARILAEVERRVLIAVLQGMKDSKVAPILAAMNAKVAQAITVELATRRSQIEAFAGTKNGS